MDQRSHHQPPMPNAPDGDGLGQQQGRPVPWPGAAPAQLAPPQRSPMPVVHHEVLPWQTQGSMPDHHPSPQGHGHGTHVGIQPQARPTPQYAYAPGFVLPGAAGGQAPPMSAHGATIGTPVPQPVGIPAAHEQVPAAPAEWQHGAVAAVAAHGPPQAWAYQTPQGLQLVQPGAVAYAEQPPAAVTGAGSGSNARRRVRWETIVPAAAVTCLVAAVALFIADFDRMTGRSSDATSASAARAVEPTGDASTSDVAPASDAAAGDAQAAEVVAQARQLFDKGRFEDAANLLHPLLDVESPDAAAVALHDRVDAAATRNRALLGRLARERSAGRWTAVIGTIGELESLRPLSQDLTKLRATARRAARVQAVVAKARSLMARRRDAEALAVVERGLEAGRNPKLEALGEQLSARMAAPATRRPSSTGDRRAPLPAGGAAARPNGGPAVRPPANVPQGAIPTRPDVPNPTGGAGSVAPTVSGGGAGGTTCHEHDGVRECH